MRNIFRFPAPAANLEPEERELGPKWQAWPLWKSIVKSNSPHLASLPGSCDKTPAGHGDIWIPSFVVELLFLIGRGLVPCMLCEHFLVPPRHCFMSAMWRNLFKSALNCVSELFCLSVFFFFFFFA